MSENTGVKSTCSEIGAMRKLVKIQPTFLTELLRLYVVVDEYVKVSMKRDYALRVETTCLGLVQYIFMISRCKIFFFRNLLEIYSPMGELEVCV